MKKLLGAFCLAITLFFLISFLAEDCRAQDLKLLDWKPVSQLVVPKTVVLQPKFPVIDIHNHLGDLDKMDEYLHEMDKAGVRIAVSLDGHSKDDFYKTHLRNHSRFRRTGYLCFLLRIGAGLMSQILVLMKRGD